MPLANRRPTRLATYDYRLPGVYFITICAHDRRCVFGRIKHDQMILSPLGKLVHTEWLRTLSARPYLEHDVHVVMPNHVHLLFGLWTDADLDMSDIPSIGEAEADRASPAPTSTASPSLSVPAIIGGYKSGVTRQARRRGLADNGPLWQPRFYDRVVRSERECAAIHAYILDNPRRWAEDRLFRPSSPTTLT